MTWARQRRKECYQGALCILLKSVHIARNSMRNSDVGVIHRPHCGELALGSIWKSLQEHFSSANLSISCRLRGDAYMHGA